MTRLWKCYAHIHFVNLMDITFQYSLSLPSADRKEAVIVIYLALPEILSFSFSFFFHSGPLLMFIFIRNKCPKHA
jgi:hypothetical protein